VIGLAQIQYSIACIEQITEGRECGKKEAKEGGERMKPDIKVLCEIS
jgi:hypothetical protein